MSSNPNNPNPENEPERAAAETAERVSKGVEAIVDVQKTNLDTASDIAADSANLFRQGVEASISIQKNILDATADSVGVAAQYGQQAFQLWNRAFWLAFSAPVAMTAQLSERGNLLGWRRGEAESRERRAA